MSEPRRSLEDHPLFQLTKVRFLEFLREPEALFWVFIFPVLLTAGLGLAFRTRAPEQVKIGVLDGPRAAAVAATLGADKRVVVQQLSDSGAAQSLRTAKIAVLVIPGESGITYRFDDTRPESRVARSMADDILQRGAGRADPLVVNEEQVRERGSRYIDFLVPGMLGMNLMGTGIWGVGFAIVDQRRKKLLKRLIATPMSRSHYLASFGLSRFIWLVLEVAMLVGTGLLIFGVPLRGSIGTLALVSFLSAAMFGGIGLLIAARPKTIEGASGIMNLVMLPMWVFSGVFFNSSNFPDAMQPFIQALPLTASVNALRSVMLEGTPLVGLGQELLVMGGWLVLSFVVALKLFRWK
ncbi:MAG TPA: ABC transporter permease [Gemmatimonadales bacterium]|nr:ABC transporter permease [Gemmatimonadales bacterium]